MSLSAKKILRRSYYAVLRLLNPFRSACAVLLYHRVLPDPAGLAMAVSVQNFEAQLKWLRAHYPVYSLEEMLDKSKSGKLAKRAVAITFDDGYADNLLMAKPVLERFQIPATIFITSAKLDSPKEFWWDDLDRIFQTEKLPLSLKIETGGKQTEWDTHSSEERKKAQAEISKILKYSNAREIERILELLCQWASLPQKGRSEYRTLTTPELHELIQGGMLRIGAHTENHLALSAQSEETQRAEIIQSKRKLEMLLGRPVTEFAYPFGLPEEHYSQKAVSIAREAGFRLACSTARACVRNSQPDFFQIPRFSVYDWNENQFAQKLNEFFNL